MKKIIILLCILISCTCNSQDTTKQETAIQTTDNDSILIRPFGISGYYKGEFTNEKGFRKANGKGRAILNGNIAEGNWKDNRLDGYGSYEIKTVSKYIGQFKNGQFCGQGSITYNNNSKYVGEWKDSKFDGKGTMTFANGAKYVGEWKDNKVTESGSFYTPDGVKHRIEWKDDKAKEKGYIIYIKNPKNSEKFILKDNKFTGNGTIVNLYGDVYTGEIKDGNTSGQGIKIYRDGSEYIGQWKNDKRDGKGTYTNTIKGIKNVGDWKEGKFNGIGSYFNTIKEEN